MKKILLMFGVVICFAYESSAETWNCGPATDGVYSDSVKCTYDETSKTLTISGEGPMGNYKLKSPTASTAPWYGKDIVHAVIEGNVTSIGDRVFKRAYNLQDIKGTENITYVGLAAFYYTDSLTSIDLPNVQSLGNSAFQATPSLEYAGLSKDVVFGENVFLSSKLSNCQNGECGSCGDKFVQAGVGCVDSCWEGYYPTNQGYCKIIKLRYTLPEADKATSDDNENMIEWIFE